VVAVEEKGMKHVKLGVLGISVIVLLVASLVLSSLFCAIPWAMVAKG
jgi:hypothetical protein